MKVLHQQSTKLSKANKRTNSRKTSVPGAIVQILDLELGDRMEWLAVLNDDNEIVVTVSKKKS